MSAEEADPNFCWIHCVIERQGELRCGECFHWFANDDELLRDFNELCRQHDFGSAATVDDVSFCPHCSHSF